MELCGLAERNLLRDGYGMDMDLWKKTKTVAHTPFGAQTQVSARRFSTTAKPPVLLF